MCSFFISLNILNFSGAGQLGQLATPRSTSSQPKKLGFEQFKGFGTIGFGNFKFFLGLKVVFGP